MPQKDKQAVFVISELKFAGYTTVSHNTRYMEYLGSPGGVEPRLMLPFTAPG